MDTKYSFTDLFVRPIDLNKDSKVTISEIIIPKIQRPYAQGRADAATTFIRDTFIENIFEALSDDKQLELNFIYGTVYDLDGRYIFSLLDGQQRITTLFLLYWYIACRELPADSDSDILIRSCLKKFRYETRATSTVFCNKLADYRTTIDDGYSPSAIIKNAKWYFKSFDRDSTIVGMLTMLDRIHHEYCKAQNKPLAQKLGNIQLFVKSLGYYNLSEELYIKMNARGLQLSPFENFKADLTKFITSSDYTGYKDEVPLFNNDGELVELNLNFSTKLDSKWVDIFWRKDDSSFDASYMSFFYRYLSAKYIKDSAATVTGVDMRSDSTIKALYTDFDPTLYLGFAVLKGVLDAHPEYIIGLDKVFDVFFSHHRDLIFHSLLPVWDNPDGAKGDDFYRNAKTAFSHTKLVVFAAIIEFIEAYDSFDPANFRKWMRVVWNVVENTNIDSLTPATNLIRVLSSMISYAARSGVKEFYASLVKWSDDTSYRENRAVVEEIEKARRIAEDPAWETIFIGAESHQFFKGMVLFFYTKGMPIDQYRHRYELAAQMFDAGGISPEYRQKHILIRAIVSRFKDWASLNKRYITESNEKEKYLKNTLAADGSVRRMLADVLDEADANDVKTALDAYINEEGDFGYRSGDDEDIIGMDIARRRLLHDIKMYDWVAQKEGYKYFRIHYDVGHVMFAIPYTQYSRLLIDTERAKVAQAVVDRYGYVFDDPNQQSMVDSYGDCFGYDLWLSKVVGKFTVWIHFGPRHKVGFTISCPSKARAKELRQLFDGSYINDDYPRSLHIPTDVRHFRKTSTLNALAKEIQAVEDTLNGLA